MCPWHLQLCMQQLFYWFTLHSVRRCGSGVEASPDDSRYLFNYLFCYAGSGCVLSRYAGRILDWRSAAGVLVYLFPACGGLTHLYIANKKD